MRRFSYHSFLKIYFSLLGVVLVILVYPFIRYTLSDPSNEIAVSSVKIVGHRGAAGHAPENTLSSFQKGLDLKVDIIELDIHLSADDELIVIHDATVDRTTNGTGAIEDLNMSEINQLDAGTWFGADFKGEKVPTLRDVLELVGDQCPLLIEIKWPSKGIYKGITQQLITLIAEYNIQESVIIQSFEKQYLQEIHALNPKIQCHQLVLATSDILPIYMDRSIHFSYFEPLQDISSVNIWQYYLHSETITNQRIKGIRSGAFTLNNSDDIRKAVSWGLEYVITDYPNRAREALSKK